MTKAKGASVELTDEQVASLERNAVEYNTTTEQLLTDIVTEWLDRHGTGEVYSPKGLRVWPEGEEEKAEKAKAEAETKAEEK